MIDTYLQLRNDFSFELTPSEKIPDVFADAVAPYATPDFVCLMNGGGLTNVFEGVEGLRHAWSDFLEAFESIHIQPAGTFEAPSGEAILEYVHISGRPRGVDADVEQNGAAVWRGSAGSLSAVEFHLDRAEAARSAGFETPPS